LDKENLLDSPKYRRETAPGASATTELNNGNDIEKQQQVNFNL